MSLKNIDNHTTEFVRKLLAWIEQISGIEKDLSCSRTRAVFKTSLSLALINSGAREGNVGISCETGQPQAEAWSRGMPPRNE